ncbi:MAG: nickel-dependent lactate racemase [Bacillota bacterium]|nr:nickel-dependent lactate racemase [Candidatus Fermentithermobacillaceae bacterium]
MATSTIEVKYGTSGLRVEIPTGNLLGILTPSEPRLPPSEEEEIQRALDNPTGSPRLEDMAKPGMSVVIMASDNTRPAPTHKLLPPLMDRLNKAGVQDSGITIMFGMGIHRSHTAEEKKALVGADIFRRCRCVDSTESGDFVQVGTTSRGTPVEVNRLVAECDLLIATGNVEYHYFVGYSGGAKAVLPGACSRRTVEANHSMQLLPGAETGSYEENPVRQDIEEAGRMVGLDFILNVVLDPGKRIVRAVAGHPVAAHEEARKVTDAVYGVEIRKKADIVIASAGGRPKDMNLYQAQKGLENAKYAVRDGGVIILTAECPEGLGEANFERYMTGMGLDEIIESVRRKFVLGAHKAAAVARVLKKADVYLVSAMDKATVERCRLLPFATLDDALDRAFSVLGSDATVWVMPYAGSTVPRYRPRTNTCEALPG